LHNLYRFLQKFINYHVEHSISKGIIGIISELFFKVVERLLNKEELAVFKTIKAYLKNKHFFKVEEIISFLNFNLDKSLNLNALRIREILESLMKKHLIAPRSKFTFEDILSNPKRKAVYHYIEENPGTYFTEIRKAKELGSRQTIWHLNMLKKFQLIRSLHIDNRDIFFKFGMEDEYDEYYYYLRNEKVKEIIGFLEKNPTPIGPTELSEDLSMHYNTVTKYLEVLVFLELVELQVEGRNNFYLFNSANYKKVSELIETSIS